MPENYPTWAELPETIDASYPRTWDTGRWVKQIDSASVWTKQTDSPSGWTKVYEWTTVGDPTE